jgi:hypothetical protein
MLMVYRWYIIRYIYFGEVNEVMEENAHRRQQERRDLMEINRGAESPISYLAKK